MLALNDSGFAFKASSKEGIPPPPPEDPGVPGTEPPGEDFKAGVAIFAGFFAPALGAAFGFEANAASSSLQVIERIRGTDAVSMSARSAKLERNAPIR